MKECLNDILAVEVIYRRKLADTETFSSLSHSLEKLGGCLELLVYDNSPEPMEPAHHDYPAWRIQYVHDAGNPGVSKAYNEATALPGSSAKSGFCCWTRIPCFRRMPLPFTAKG
ncbi:hypothetical protein [Geotalea toluenoxydans]|uniref:hypothetical protein n=1 Tax=Geotalea toluenoxydans TaxID=421624 RepID=UPI0006D25F3D|nr:hypothetical protein [Geotalea toluenoxydans]